MTLQLLPLLGKELNKLAQAGLYKRDVAFRPDGSEANKELINYTSHDYLGLGRDPDVLDAGIHAMRKHGFGQASARLLVGTRSVHQELESSLAHFLGVPASMVYSSGYLANVGLFQCFFDDRDFVFCDELISPSLAEGVRLAGAKTYSYRNNDLEDLEDKLKRSRTARFRAVVTTGVFPFDGTVANLASMCRLAKKYEAVTIVDDSLGIGVVGERSRGSCELRNVIDEVDVITGTFGKALGGSGGGFIAGRKEIVSWLKQKSTPFLFGNALSPATTGGVLKVLEMLSNGRARQRTLFERVKQLRHGLTESGFEVIPGEHALVAVSIGNVVTMQKMINLVYERGIYAHGLCYPIVAEREDRIILHVTALHTADEINQTAKAFAAASRELGL